jgi:hypothetical protein
MLMSNTPTPSDGSSRTGLAALGVGVLAVVCCAAAPLLVGVLGGIALGSLLGVAAGVVAVIGLTALVVVRTRRRRACAAPTAGLESPA